MLVVYDVQKEAIRLEIVESILSRNPCYKNGKKIKIEGIVLHSTCSPQPSAKVLVHNWNRNGSTKGVHALISAVDGTVYQTLPWNQRGHHCGKHPDTKKSADDKCIGIEMCEPAKIKYKKDGSIELAPFADADSIKLLLTRTYDSAVELSAFLCSKFNSNPINIMSHSEAYEKGLATDKRDPEHLWTMFNMPYTMESFRSDVSKKLEGDKNRYFPSDENRYAEKKAIQINVGNLRIRIGPGVDYEPTGKYTGQGLFYITEIQNGTGSEKGWAKLENGSGWVSLDYVKIIGEV